MLELPQGRIAVALWGVLNACEAFSSVSALQGWQKLVETTVQEEEEQEEGGGGGGGGGKDTILANQAFLLVQQISANIVSYCRVAMTIGGGCNSIYCYEMLIKGILPLKCIFSVLAFNVYLRFSCSSGKEFSSPYCRVLLTPDLSEALAIPPNQDPFASPSSSSGTRPPSLGLLIQHLKECTDGFAVAFESYQHYSKKMEVGTPLSSEDIRQVTHSLGIGQVGITGFILH